MLFSRTMIRLRQPTLETLDMMARQGVSRRFVDELAEVLGLQTYDLAPQLHVSDRTLRRYGPDQLLPPEASERALQIARVIERATAVWGRVRMPSGG